MSWWLKTVNMIFLCNNEDDVRRYGGKNPFVSLFYDFVQFV